MNEPVIEIKYGAYVYGDGDPRPAFVLPEENFKNLLRAYLASSGGDFEAAFSTLKAEVARKVRKALQ